MIEQREKELVTAGQTVIDTATAAGPDADAAAATDMPGGADPIPGAASTAVIHTDVREDPLSVDEVVAAVSHRTAGGIALFLGVVRDHDHGRSVTALDYTAHPSAADLLAKVAQDVAAAHPDVVALSAIHRVGALDIGDLAVVVGAAAPHRAEAFAACRAFIDTLKEQVPIWKREEFADGDHEWVGC